MSPDTSRWTKIGESVNAEFFAIEPTLLAVVPAEGSTDDATSAAESVRIQLEHLRATSRRAGVIVYMDRVVAQNAAARAVYRDAPDPAYQACFALVGGTLLGRAIASLFVGLHPPRVPTRFFATEEEAVAWARAMTTSSR